MTSLQDWTMTASRLPPEGVVVAAMDSSGNVQPLKRRGNLWFTPDELMYVYFTPRYWQEIAP